jgi:GAF domain-containing protein
MVSWLAAGVTSSLLRTGCREEPQDWPKADGFGASCTPDGDTQGTAAFGHLLWPCAGSHRLTHVDTPEEMDDFERLHDLVTGMEDIKGLLDGMTGLAAEALARTAGASVECAVTLHRRKRPATIAGSSDQAILLDGIEQRLGDGPCLHALRTGVPVLLGDVSSDTRWPELRRELAGKGFGSVLGVPLGLGENASAVLDFFAAGSGAFTEEAINDAERFADVASRALRLALRIAAAELRADDLTAALDHRTTIDMARGIIMAQNRCTGEEAFEMLRRASSARNQKLHEIAWEIVAAVAGAPGATYFEP